MSLKAKLAAWFINKKLDLKEGPVGKNWWQSKAVWAAVFITLRVGVEQISAAFGHPIQIPQFVDELAIALGIYGLRTAKKEIK